MDGSARPAGSAVALTSSPLNRTSTWGSCTPALQRIRQAMGERKNGAGDARPLQGAGELCHNRVRMQKNLLRNKACEAIMLPAFGQEEASAVK